MTEKKITKKEMFGAMFAGIAEGQMFEINRENETIEVTAKEMKNFITHEIELLNRKKSSGKAKTETEENQKLIDLVLTYFRENPNAVMTCTQLMELVPANITQSKMTSIMTKICGNVKEPILNAPIIRVRDKRKTFFQANK